MKNLIPLIIAFFFFTNSNAQNFGVGGSAMYNFQTESFGLGARANFFPNSTLSFVPQFTYYPGWGPVKEYMIGMALELKIKRGNTLNWYLLGHGAYNNWQNHENSAMEGAEPSNINLEAGLGVATNSCLRPFLEYRYNTRFQETHLRLGLLYIFGCSGGGNTGRRVGGHGICPAYN